MKVISEGFKGSRIQVMELLFIELILTGTLEASNLEASLREESL